MWRRETEHESAQVTPKVCELATLWACAGLWVYWERGGLLVSWACAVLRVYWARAELQAYWMQCGTAVGLAVSADVYRDGDTASAIGSTSQPSWIGSDKVKCVRVCDCGVCLCDCSILSTNTPPNSAVRLNECMSTNSFSVVRCTGTVFSLISSDNIYS